MAEGDGTARNVLKAGILGAQNLASGGDVLKLSLVSTVTVEIDGVLGIADLTKHNGSNYVDKTLVGQVVAQDDDADKGWLDAEDVTWYALGAPSVPTTWVVLWNSTTAGNPILSKWVVVQQSDGRDYKFTWSANGLINVP